MSFDDEKWMDEEDAEWESIDTKHKWRFIGPLLFSVPTVFEDRFFSFL